ncbi:hypothetical protein EVG20_g8014 [Dentipellis fragilis]|uniref:Uncharacterized protein n=1 Tax=Dentipellis fragilis TaxID=205917 RepID=A0A4Y9YA84_9AGAM|nr:hypothetical protein EVG20_g8014 [Dentipellis fragilis]
MERNLVSAVTYLAGPCIAVSAKAEGTAGLALALPVRSFPAATCSCLCPFLHPNAIMVADAPPLQYYARLKVAFGSCNWPGGLDALIVFRLPIPTFTFETCLHVLRDNTDDEGCNIRPITLPVNDAPRSPSQTRLRHVLLSRTPKTIPASQWRRQAPARRTGVHGHGKIHEADEALKVEQPLLIGYAEKKGETEARRKVDWEITRKTLHSSIGAYSASCASQVCCALSSRQCALPVLTAFRAHIRACLGFLMCDSEKTDGVDNDKLVYRRCLFMLTLYPLDIVVTSIMMCLSSPSHLSSNSSSIFDSRWADTAASTFGRLWGKLTPALPSRFLGLPLSPLKSTAGSIAATGFAIAIVFWESIADSCMSYDWTRGIVGEGRDTSAVDAAVRVWLCETGWEPVQVAGWVGLGL